MSCIIDIATAVPEFTIEKGDLERFYSEAAGNSDKEFFLKKLNFLNRKTSINKRHSSIPDYNGADFELYKNGNYTASVDDRMALYKTKVLPLASTAIDKVLQQTGIASTEITHLVTVSCTGQFAPGFEFLVARHYGLEHIEKTALNFLGCYAGVKALKQANYIALSDPDACVLIVCAELCSLHFYPSFSDEDMVANLLFSDGAAAVIVCGERNRHVQDKVVLKLDNVATAIIPGSAELMTWDITSTAFRMFLSKDIVKMLQENIQPVIKNFLGRENGNISHWAIHPGGVKIVEAVQEAMGLNKEQLKESYDTLRDYGNMSSPTILFILKKMLDDLKSKGNLGDENIFVAAFGPGINVEMITLACIDNSMNLITSSSQAHAVQE
ncbi:MAG: type III polyketide synthase [Bacteroidetes bacterium]|nr:type III polyketide synthase [Bacteroidota bacterium]